MKRVPASLRKKARNPAEARGRYRGFIQGTLACVNKTVQLFVGSSPLGSENSVTLEPCESPIPLTTYSGERLYLKVEQQGEVIKDGRFRGEYRITTRSYHYAVLLGPASQEPIIAWDWHPGTSPDHAYPHIHTSINDHLGRGISLHIPTGKRVTIEQVVAFLISEMDVVPVVEEWAEILGEHQSRFDKFQVQDRSP